MRHDKYGSPLGVGDQVVIAGEVVSMDQNNDGVNMTVRVDDAFGPGDSSFFSMNSRACCKAPPGPNAVPDENPRDAVPEPQGPSADDAVEDHGRGVAPAASAVGGAVCVLLLLMPLLGGCLGSSGVGKLFDAWGETAKASTQAIIDQGVIDKFTLGTNAHFHDPGVESYLRCECAAGVRMTGADGEVYAETGGSGTQLPTGLRNAIIEACQNQTRTPEEFDSCMERLFWNRTPEGGNPNAPKLSVERAMTPAEVQEMIRRELKGIKVEEPAPEKPPGP